MVLFLLLSLLNLVQRTNLHRALFERGEEAFDSLPSAPWMLVLNSLFFDVYSEKEKEDSSRKVIKQIMQNLVFEVQ